MRVNSITFKLLVIIVGAFIVATGGILVLADIQLKRIVDDSQEAVFTERIDTITGYLSRSNERLKKTGLVEAYTDDFQQSALTYLRTSYYKETEPIIYPFIIDTRGTVIMHPVLATGDQSIKDTPIAGQLLASKDGHFEAVFGGQSKWYRHRSFDAWDWVIGYAVPLKTKYRDARIFRDMLILIATGVSLAVLVVLSLVVRRFTRPIVDLTEAAQHVAQGELDRPIDLGGSDEVGVLARTFESMREAIQNKIDALSNEINERKQAEHALQESEARLSEAQKLAGLGYWEWTITSGKVIWSEEVYRIFRLDPKTFRPDVDSVMRFSPWPEYNRRHEELIQRALDMMLCNRVKAGRGFIQNDQGRIAKEDPNKGQ